MKIKERWSNLKYWQKTGITCGGLYLILNLFIRFVDSSMGGSHYKGEGSIIWYFIEFPSVILYEFFLSFIDFKEKVIMNIYMKITNNIFFEAGVSTAFVFLITALLSIIVVNMKRFIRK